MKRLSHVGADGRAKMVDVSHKPASAREAVAVGRITLNQSALAQISDGTNPKGDVFSVARIAGIQAAKQTAQLIPLCHSLALSEVKVAITPLNDGVEVECSARTVAQTGVEMEALTGVSVALLTIYDMCKAADKQMAISEIKLMKKTKEAVAAVYDRRSQNRRRS
jgi:cyclic pyranopterin phosphate synthase